MVSAPDDASLMTWKSEKGIGRIIIVDFGTLTKEITEVIESSSSRAFMPSLFRMCTGIPVLSNSKTGFEMTPSVVRSTDCSVITGTLFHFLLIPREAWLDSSISETSCAVTFA